jgi:hypothetical protein
VCRDDVNRHIGRRHANRAEYLLRVLYADEAKQWHTKQRQRLLAVNEHNHAAATLFLNLANQAQACRFQHTLANHRHHRQKNKNQPK